MLFYEIKDRLVWGSRLLQPFFWKSWHRGQVRVALKEYNSKAFADSRSSTRRTGTAVSILTPKEEISTQSAVSIRFMACSILNNSLHKYSLIKTRSMICDTALYVSETHRHGSAIRQTELNLDISKTAVYNCKMDCRDPRGARLMD